MKIAIFQGNTQITTKPEPWNSWVRPADNAKSYPWWQAVVALLQDKGHDCYQFFSPNSNEQDVGANYKLIGTLEEIEKILPTLDCFISTDTFIQHLVVAKCIDIKGVVIWSKSDPNIFGYPERFVNLYKPEYFRHNQYDVWLGEQRDLNSFPSVQEVVKAVINS